LIKEFEPKGYHTVFISGKEVRNKLKNGEDVDERILRKCVGDILKEYFTAKDKTKVSEDKKKSSNVVLRSFN
ncbi:hypothetical protein, partial [Thioalkalivibrio sp.]|uniref:hypothetical protein n=1 Tax=Thioalkalivibrio sp. TaxID=2093813 RepID=UPI0039770CB1